MDRGIRRSARGLAVAAALVVAVTAMQTHAQGNPEAEFKKIADQFAAAWNKGDATAIAALHAEDAVRLNGDGTVASGRAAIAKGMTEALGGMWKDSRLTITPNQYKRVTDDVYVGEGTYRISGGTPPAGAPTSGSYMNTMARRGGRWMIAGSAVFSPPPPPAK